MGALDLDLEPQDAEVFVDGYLVGNADQFDGYPDYLWLEEGTYEVAFFRHGYQTLFRQYTIYPGVIVEVDDRMRKGEAVRPEPSGGGYPPETEPVGPASGEAFGRIALSGSPSDAAVYLDGHFVGTAGEISRLSEGLLVEPGDHVVELVRPGYGSERRPVSVAAGERIDFDLGLKPR